MDKRAWFLFGAATIAILVGLVFYSKQDKIDLADINGDKVFIESDLDKNKSGLTDNIIGKKDSKVILVEYGDYSCGGCAMLDSKIQPVINEYKDRVAFVFRHFPLTSIHPNSLVAATYAEAAGLQGKYWDMHHILFKNQEKWAALSQSDREVKLKEYAKTVNLDLDKLEKDITDERISKKIKFDQQLGKKYDVSATPTLFLNGKKLNEEVGDMNKLKDALNQALKEAK